MKLLLIEIFGYQFTTFEAFAALVAGILTLGAVFKAVDDIRKNGWTPFKDRWITPLKTRRKQRNSLVEEFGKLAVSCETMGQQITEVLREVKPNGGSSLRDEVTSIGNRLENINARVRHQDEKSDEAIFHLDDEGRMLYTNGAFREMIHAEEAQLQYHDYLSQIHNDDRQRFIQCRREAIEFRMPLDVIVRFKVHGPHFIPIRLQASPDVRHGGVLKLFFGTASKVDDPPIAAA